MRVLFLHLTREKAYEYSVHRLIANSAPADVESLFIWQDGARQSARVAGQEQASSQTVFYEFGRNLSMNPKPSSKGRAWLMVRQLPGGLRAIGKQIQAFKPDVIYTSQQWYDIYMGTLLSRIYGLPHVTHVHFQIGPWLRYGVEQLLARKRHIITVSNFIREQVISLGVAQEAVQTIYNTTEFTRFVRPASREQDRARIRAEFGWDAETPLVVAAGRLDRQKGQSRLIDSFAQTKTQVPTAKLLICGIPSYDDGYVQDMHERVQKLGLKDDVIFAGSRPDIDVVLNSADIFALPTEDEAFGLVFLEAMAAGVPVVACRSGGVPEVVEDGATGLLSELGDTAALASNLTYLLTHPAEARAMGQKGALRATSVFGPATIAAQWSESLRQIVESSRRKSAVKFSSQSHK